MNRLKLWVYMVVLLGAGIGNVCFLSRWFTDRSIAQLDRELVRAASQVDARSQIIAFEAAQLADAAARDPAVVQALSSNGDAAAAARAAAQVARGEGADPARSLLAAVMTGGTRTISVNGAPIQADARIEDLLSGVAGDATRSEGYVAVGDGLYYLVATPAGKGASVAVGVPITAAWLAVLREATGCDVTLLLLDRTPRGTLPARDTSLIARAAGGVAGPVDAGALPPQAPTIGSGLPPLPLLLARAPAYRVRTVALKGLPGGELALSLPTGPLLAPLVTYSWLTLLALAMLLLLGLATGLLITNEQKTMVPKDLVAAADRITRGDFSARAPVMAGSLGTIATALNRAAEAAQGATISQPAAEGPRWADAGEGVAAPQAPGAPGGTSPDLFGARAGEPPSAPEPRGALLSAVPSEDAAAPPEYPEAALHSESAETTAASWGAPADYSPKHAEHAMAAVSSVAVRPEEHPEAAARQFEMPPPEPEPSPWAASEPPPEDGASLFRSEPAAPEPEPDRRGDAGYTAQGPMEGEPATGLSEPPERTAALELEHRGEAALHDQGAPGGEPGASDEEHWRVVYSEFLKTREQCGEPREGVPYDRFRLKLQKNRDQLVAKYACRTVRFQVYVKEGKAALKASPVR